MKPINQCTPLAAGLLWLLLVTFNSLSVSAQKQSPVQWNFYSRQLAPTIYEFHTVVSIREGWCFRPQTPVDKAPVIGELVFLPHSNVCLTNIIGSERTVTELPATPATGDRGRSYESGVHLVHLVQLVRPQLTNLSGVINYTICNDQQRQLLQDSISFHVVLR